jgi:hypothetical protein
MPHAAKQESLRRRLVRAIPAIALAFVASIVLNRIGILDPLERFLINIELTGNQLFHNLAPINPAQSPS